jgi:hypothetical protein
MRVANSVDKTPHPDLGGASFSPRSLVKSLRAR